MYIIFLSKYGKDIKLTDLSKKLNIPLKSINDGMKFLEEQKLVTKKNNRICNSRLTRTNTS